MTLLCKLFGHKFMGKNYKDNFIYDYFPIPYCTRCGLTKQELGIEIPPSKFSNLKRMKRK